MRSVHNDHSSGLIHFKKKWLHQDRQERAMASAGVPSHDLASYQEQHGAASHFSSAAAHLETSIFSPRPQEEAPRSSGHFPSLALNISQFAKYGSSLARAPPPLLSQCSAGSSVLSHAHGSDALHRSWLQRQPFQDLEHYNVVAVGSADRQPPTPMADRMLIDINKPPPSPTHSMDSEVAPSTPCSGPLKEILLPSPHLLPQIADNSLSPSSVAHKALGFPSPLGSSSRKARAGLLHLPLLRRQSSELVEEHRERGAKVPSLKAIQQHQQLPAVSLLRKSPTSVLAPSPTRKPRSSHGPGQHQWGVYISGAVGSSAAARSARRSLEVESEEGDSHQHEDEDADVESGSGAVSAEKRESSEEVQDGEQGRGGALKACLHCGTTRTPLWRNGPPGPKSLCNACGIRFNKIRSGKRKPTPKEASMLLKYECSGSSSSSFCSEGAQFQGRASLPARTTSGALPSRTASGVQADLLDLPVATLHRSRSKPGQHRQGNVSPVAASRKREAEAVAPEGVYKRHPLIVDVRSAKKICTERAEAVAHASDGSRAGSSLSGAALRPGLIGSVKLLEENVEADEGSSSEHESCLSEPAEPQRGSPPAWDCGVDVANSSPRPCREGEPAGLSKPEDTRRVAPQPWKMFGSDKGGDEDVEAGARLLMEIFHGALAPVEC